MGKFYDFLANEGQNSDLFCHSSRLLIRRVLKEKNKEGKVTICEEAKSLLLAKGPKNLK